LSRKTKRRVTPRPIGPVTSGQSSPSLPPLRGSEGERRSLLVPATVSAGLSGGRDESEAIGATDAAGAAFARERRISAQQKVEIVVRLVRGEALDALAREFAVTAATLSEWRDRFFTAARAGLKSRDTGIPQDEELREAKVVLGELAMRNELLMRERQHFLDQGANPFPSRRSTP
jgi:transposase